MNLGNFAGGLSQGLQQGQRLNMERDQQAANNDFRNRQLNIQEADEAAKAQAAQRAQAGRDGMAELMQKYYGPQQVPDDSQSNLGADPSAPPPMKTIQVKPGDDPERDASFYNDHLMLAAKTSGASMEDMMHVANAVDTARRTAAGKALDKVLAGDSDAMGTFLKHIGKDPYGAKLDFRPVDGVQQIVLKDGTSVDLKRAAAASATAAYVKQMQDAEKEAQGTEKNKAAAKNLNAEADAHAASAGEAPAKIELLKAEGRRADAQAGLAGAKAKNVGAAGAAAGDLKTDKEALVQAKALAAPDPTSMDGKTKDPDEIAFLVGKSAEHRAAGTKSVPLSVSQAKKEWNDVSTAADAWVKTLASMSQKDRKAKYGSSDLAAIKKEAMRRKLGTSFAQPTTNVPNLDDGEE